MNEPGPEAPRDQEIERWLLTHLPVHEIPSDRLDAIRFELDRAARTSSAEAHAPPNSRGGRGRALVLGLGLVLAFTIAAFAVSTRASAPRAPAHASLAESWSRRSADLGWSAPPKRDARASGAVSGQPANEPQTSSGADRREALHSLRPARVRDRAPAVTGRARYDGSFALGLSLFNDERFAESAKLFDSLGREPGIDSDRRSDALFWAARAHQAAGHTGESISRAEELVEQSPRAWHADDAALLAARNLLAEGDEAGARAFIERAMRSPRVEVRAEARHLLERLER